MQHKKIRILFLINGLRLGGAEKHLFNLAMALDREKFAPIIRCMFCKGELFTDAQKQGVDIDFMGIKRIYGISGIIGLVRLARFIRREKVDIVQSQLFSENILGALAAWLGGAKAIITSRRDTGMLREGKLRHILAYRFTNLFVDKIVCVSNAVKRIVLEKERVSPEKVEVIYNGVDVSKFAQRITQDALRQQLGIADSDFVAGMIANFTWIKGQQDFIQAAKLVLQEIPNVKFLLIGDGPLKDKFEHDVLRTPYAVRNNILFLGSRQDIPELLSIIDVSVNASYSEGMSNTLLESMAAGVPVVATAVDGNLETINDGVNGIFVPPKSSRIMADLIIRLLKEKNLAQRLSENARKLVQEKFTQGLMVKNFENLYLQLLKPKVAMLLSQFPEMHETFILREFQALNAEKHIDFKIFSLKPCKDKLVHPEAKALLKNTTYAKAHSSWLIAQSIIHPLKTLSTLAYVVKSYYKNPIDLSKGLYVWLECLNLTKLMRKEKISHIHSHWATLPTTAAVILNKLSGTPYSFTAHAWDIFVNAHGLAEKIARAKFVVTCTDYNRRYLELLRDSPLSNSSGSNLAGTVPAKLAGTVPAKLAETVPLRKTKIYLNYHGINLDDFKYKECESSVMRDALCAMRNAQDAKRYTQDAIRILAIGRLVETKGFEYLITACGMLKEKGIDFACNIIGSGPLLKSLKLQVKSYKLEQRIKFLGIKNQEEIKKLCSEATVFVAPSVVAKNGDRDGIPNVILEAMALGIPVVTSNISGIPEVVIDSQTGLLVPEKNSTALADAIQKLAEDSILRESLSLNARKLIEDRFDAGKNVERLMRIFGENDIPVGTVPLGQFSQSSGGDSPCFVGGDSPSAKKINVLYVIWSLKTGGAERVVVNMAKGLNRERFNPLICCLNEKGELAEELEREGIPVVGLNKKGKFDFSITGKLAKIMQVNQIQIVHTHLWGANFWGRIAAKKAAVPVVIAHEHGIELWRGRLHAYLDKLLYKHTDRVVFVSEASRDLFLSQVKVGPEKCRVIYNGVDVEKFAQRITPNALRPTHNEQREKLGIKEGDFVIITIGRLVKEKAHEYLLAALKLVSAQKPNVRALIVGDGPRMEELKRLKESLGLNGALTFLGTRNDIREILSASDLFVLSSSKEAMPLSALEAMAAAKAVVATNVGGNQELIINEKTGLLVPPRDSLALAEAILRIIDQRGLAQEMAKAGQKRIRELFSKDNWMKNLEALYAESLEKN